MSKGMQTYKKTLLELIEKINDTQAGQIEKVADMMADAITGGQNIFVFGPSHAGMFTEEMVYRAGSISVVNPIHAAALLPNMRPLAMTSEIERLVGYGSLLLDTTALKAGDLLIIHSVSARLPIVIEMAIKAKERGIKIAAIVSMDYANNVTSLDPSGKMLNEVADIVIDNCGVYGDACVTVEGMEHPVAPTSTVAAAFIGNTLNIMVCEKLLAKGVEPPVFRSGNIDGAGEYNKQILEKNKEHIFYML